jgi:hypothetical protein
MKHVQEISHQVPFTSLSSLEAGFHVNAALGGGAPHVFLVDTGSVGILVPRRTLGPDYQNFDPSHDTTFGYVSSGKTYHGQWVKVPVVLGVPPSWDGTGDYPTAQIEVFAVDRPDNFDGGLFGIGFAIGKSADGGPTRNPLLHMTYQGTRLGHGYIVSTTNIEVGLTGANSENFVFVPLERNDSNEDWEQPVGSVKLDSALGGDSVTFNSTILMDTGIPEMILWIDGNSAPFKLPSGQPFPAGITAIVSWRDPDQDTEPALDYTFVTGDETQSMAPSFVEWRKGDGINTGRNVLAGYDYLYDAKSGRIGFRSRDLKSPQ